MGGMQIDGNLDVIGETFPTLLADNVQQSDKIPSGALGKRLHPKALLGNDDSSVKGSGHVSLPQVDKALSNLMEALPPSVRPVARELLTMDPMILSMMMMQLGLSVSGNTANSLCKQLERSTEVQTALRNKQVAEYQEQIQKAIEQSDQVRKSAATSIVFGWIISCVEEFVGVMKMASGLATGDALAIADGAAYMAAGFAGMVKVGAEIAEQAGADKSTCEEVSNISGKVQTSCECVALALDVIQIGRGISAARAITKATEEVMESGVGKKIIDAVAKGAEEELKVLAEKAGQEVSKMVGKDFGMALEREMVEVGDMAIEALAHEAEAELHMVGSMGESFTREGVAKLVEEAIIKAGKELLNEGEKVVMNKIRDAILKELRGSIIKTVIADSIRQSLTVTRAAVGGANKISSSVVAARTAKLQTEIERLMMQEGFNDFMLEWMEERKKTQQKRLKETYQDGANTQKVASDIIDNSGTVLANIAGMLA